LIDSHCHLDNDHLYDRLPALMAAAENCGVERFIVPGIEPQGWSRIVALAAIDERIFAALGVHPQKAAAWSTAAAETLQQLVPDIVAIGEIGLDYTDGMPLRELQKEVFRGQLQLAREVGLPVIIHCRRAFADTIRILAEERIGEFGGVMHAFSGSVEVARICISMGLKIGVAGSVTWKNAVRPIAIVKSISLQDILLETDSPDLPPASHRGVANEPAFLIDTALKVAEIKGISIDEVADVTSENARLLFRLTDNTRSV